MRWQLEVANCDFKFFLRSQIVTLDVSNICGPPLLLKTYTIWLWLNKKGARIKIQPRLKSNIL